MKQTPRKTTTKNNQSTTIRSPEFSPPPNNRKQKTSVVRSLCLSDELQPYSNTYNAQRKREQRAREDEQQHNIRLMNDRIRKQVVRENETAEGRNARLLDKRVRAQITRSNEIEEERNRRLSHDRARQEVTRQNEDEDERRGRLAQQRKRTAEHRSNSRKERHRKHRVYGDISFETEESDDEEDSNQTSVKIPSSRQRISQKRQSMIFDQYIWPSSIPRNLKEQCLEEFSNHMSMPFLRQSICIVCNTRTDFNTMKEYSIEDISNLDYLSYHSDISNIISEIQQQSVQGTKRMFRIIDIILMSFQKIIVQIQVSFFCPMLFFTKKDTMQRPKLVIFVNNVTMH